MAKRPAGAPQKFDLDGSDSDMDGKNEDSEPEEDTVKRDRVTALWFHHNEPNLSEDHGQTYSNTYV